MKINLKRQVWMYISYGEMHCFFATCHSIKLSSRLQHIYSNDSVIHGREMKTKGTRSNRGRQINKALITGIRFFFKGRNILAIPEAPLFPRIWLTEHWATPPALHDQDEGLEHLLTVPSLNTQQCLPAWVFV